MPGRNRETRVTFLRKLLAKNKRRRKLLHTILMVAVARRRMMLRIAVLMLVMCANSTRKRNVVRSCRRFVRNSGWWELVWNYYNDARFKTTFRISRATFMYILDKVRHKLEKKIVAELPVSPEQRLAIFLYRCGRGDYYYSIAEMTGLGVATVCCIVSDVAKAIVEVLWESEVSTYMPKSETEFYQKISDMEQMWQFPCCWGAIDGCHIPIKCPQGGLQACKEYHNFKNFYSIVLMGMVDAKYRFIWGSCGFPGNSHDSVILQSTDLWDQIQDRDYLPNIAKKINGVVVPPLILADSAFQLKSWLMKPYTKAKLTSKERYFNYRLSRARMVTECAYGQLKGRWRILMRKCESLPDEVKMVTLACMVLHNICISKGDLLPRTLDITIDPNTNQRRESSEIRDILHMMNPSRPRDYEKKATNIRDLLANKFWLEKQAINEEEDT